ncbi:MAG: efflux RND transporter periplasmic adaptor subunit [Deltaproteobacteria bacterium]|nr:efflux RND transporter periplasmic adaptor subunit [Deltaproteobacteria bacterium]
MIKRIVLVIVFLIVLTGILAGIKYLQISRMIAKGEKAEMPPETVTSAGVRSESWGAKLTAVGSLAAVQGVTVSAEVSGKVVHLGFESGGIVQSGAVLLKQDTDSEEAQLRGAEASWALAKLNFERYANLLRLNLVSRLDYDNAEAQYKQTVSQGDYLRSIIGKKTIRAPFSGRLGIRLVNLGQMLREGDQIVSLQSLDPVYVNFLLPQQQLGQIRTGLAIRVTTDALSGQVIEGRITAINAEVDAATRNIQVQGTVANPKKFLFPGMFVNVEVVLPARENVLVIPTPAVLYAAYSDSVFIVEEKTNEKDGQPVKIVRQQFITLGEKRGDFVSVVSGLKEGDTVVSTGVFKLRNGQTVTVDNAISPDFKLSPKPDNN